MKGKEDQIPPGAKNESAKTESAFGSLQQPMHKIVFFHSRLCIHMRKSVGDNGMCVRMLSINCKGPGA